MVSPIGAPSLTQSNPTGSIYLSGNERSDGSIRLILDASDSLAHIETRANGVWNDASLRAHTAVQASTPVGSIIPGIIGEFNWDSANNRLYVAEGITSADWVFVGGDTDDFIELNDTPGTYTGKAGLVVQVDSGETGLEFGQALKATSSPTFAGLTLTGDLVVNGTTTTINSTTLTVDDKNIELGSVLTPTDVTADGGGITLKGAIDKTIIWDNVNDNWTFNQSVNIDTGLNYKVNNVSVLNATTLGASVINSSLTNLGALTALTMVNNSTLELRQGARIKLSGGSGENYIEGNVGNSGRIGIFTDNSERMKIWLSGQIDFTNLVTITGDFKVNTNTLFVDSTNNKVGIGTITPTEVFEVFPNTETASIIGKVRVGFIGLTDWAGFTHQALTTNGSNYSIIQNSVGRTLVNSASGQNLEFRISNLTKLFISSVGAVGIATSSPNSKLQVEGSFSVKRLSTAVSAGTADEVIIGVTDTTAARTITIQTADIVIGRVFIVKDESGAAGTNNITIATEGSQTIDGASTALISTNYGSVSLYSDGVNLFTW